MPPATRDPPQPTKRHQCILSLVDVQSDDGKDDDTDDETIIYETGVPNLEIDTLEGRPKAKAKGKAQASKRWVLKTKALKPKKDKVGGQRVG